MPNESRLNNKLYLSDLNPGDEAIIAGIRLNAAGQDRIRELGLVDGTFVRVIKFAPLGDPIEIKLRGYYLSIRRSIAKHIQVQKRNRGGEIEI